jgi:hypothetical protein
MKRFCLFIGLLFILTPVFSQQIREFTTDTLVYIDELQGFMKDLNQKEETELSRFISIWKNDSISYDAKLEIIKASNNMLSRRARPKPHFTSYFSIYLKSQSPGYQDMGLNKWLDCFNHLVGDRTIQFRDTERFLDLSLLLIDDSILYNLAGTQWKPSNVDFSFDHENFHPFVVFKNTDLFCYSNRDTLKILNTSGKYDLLKLKWFGNGGEITWEKAGYQPDEVYAKLSSYQLELNRAQFTADSVKFFYPKYFSSELEGRLEEKALPINAPEAALYPKFFSYQNKYFLPSLFKDMEFSGGLSMQGAKLIGTGVEGDPANLDVFENDTLRMTIQAQNFLILENGINSLSVSLVLYLETDFIYHPDLHFTYFEDTDEMRFSKGDNYTSGVPFRDSYHNVDMNFDEMVWKRGTDLLKIQAAIGRSIGKASFESQNAFNFGFYGSLQGMDYVNPIVSLWHFSRELNDIRQFPVVAFANNIGMADYQVRHQLMKLSRMGFIFFDDKSDMITLNEKLFYYIDASVGRIDYDVLYFNSEVRSPQENADLNIRNFDLTIYGIPQIFLSDSQNVVLIPDGNKIIMKKDRNFQFDGAINAGLFEFYGHNFFFEYDDFKVNLQDIDSLRLSVKTENKNSGVSFRRAIENLIQDLTGELYIDNPANKSGLQDFPDYPTFISREKGYVYFDDPDIQGGVYDRNKVFFAVDTFSIDSLDNFSEAGMKLSGMFESGGMMPPLKQTLTLRDDYSLGFAYKTPENGMPVYNGKGTFFMDIEMSSNGLRGSGQLNYLSSTTYSDDFIFHPDSLKTLGREFQIKKQTAGTAFPRTHNTNTKIRWLPAADEFYAYRTEKPFTILNDTILMKGDLLLEPTGLSGHGIMDMSVANLQSDKFEYGSDSFRADTASFKMKSLSPELLAINAENLRANIDLKSSSGQFFANDDFTLVEFPETRYMSHLDFFKWNMVDENIEMGLGKDVSTGFSAADDSLSGPRYISLHPMQDSLSFVSPLAFFNYKKGILNATQVPYIQVADSRVYPDEGLLSVAKNAKMQMLNNASILTNFETRYYNLYNANVNINGKFDYTASADYDYKDIAGDIYTLHFNNISVDSSLQTIGSGLVSVADSFKLSPYFEYQGKLSLASNNPHLLFDGGTRLTHSCEIGKRWVKFKTEINPDDIRIPVSDQALDINLNPTYFGTLISRDSTHIYSAFSSAKKDRYFDFFLTTSQGYLRYNPENNRYELASEEKLKDMGLPGNYLALDRSECVVYSEGKIDFQVKYGELKMSTYGEAVHNYSEDDFSTKVLMALDFYFSDEAFTEFARELDSISDLKPFDLSDEFYKQALREFVGLDAADRLDADMGLYGEYRTIPPSFNQKLIFSDVNLKWNPLSRTYQYHGDISIIRIGGRTINKKVEAYIELTKRSSGDLLDIYFKINERNWYYLGYNPGSLEMVSSNRVFNQIIFNTKDKDRKVKTRVGNTGYIYNLAVDRRANLFLRRFTAGNEESLGEGETNN